LGPSGDELPDWVLTRLACPRDWSPLRRRADALECTSGHAYPVRDGIPVLLLEDVPHTHQAALHALQEGDEPEKYRLRTSPIDPFVQEAIGATGGYLYAGLAGRLTEYPIPELRMAPGAGRTFLDLGSNWGRWSIAAARMGYRALGVDPSINAVRAARRVVRQLGVEASFIVADARYLPCAAGTFDAVFSYSVLQHFAKTDVHRTLREIRRVLASDGESLIQLPNAFGVRSAYHQGKRGLREPRAFEVRYWTVPELRRVFNALVGPSEVTVDGFFSLNPQAADLPLLSPGARAVVRASELFRRMSQAVPALAYVADSLYVRSRVRPSSKPRPLE
jgi:SAM-dependent methyltransferase